MSVVPLPLKSTLDHTAISKAPIVKDFSCPHLVQLNSCSSRPIDESPVKVGSRCKSIIVSIGTCVNYARMAMGLKTYLFAAFHSYKMAPFRQWRAF